MTIGDRIKNRREELNMSQNDLAVKLGLKDKSSISKIEKSKDDVSLKNVEKMALALNCSIPFLMGWDVYSPAAPLRPDESELLSNYNSLNSVGRDKAQEYVTDLTEQAKYTVDDTSKKREA